MRIQLVIDARQYILTQPILFNVHTRFVLWGGCIDVIAKTVKARNSSPFCRIFINKLQDDDVMESNMIMMLYMI